MNVASVCTYEGALGKRQSRINHIDSNRRMYWNEREV
jgi:hypothetical protein